MRLTLLALLLVWPVLLQAGAWPREEGTAFAALSYELTTWQDAASEERLIETEGEIETFGYTAFYFEYGLLDRLTLGIDHGDADADYSRTTLAFARLTVTPAEWRTQVAVELGIGEREIATFGLRRGATEPVIRPGLSIGRGWETPLGAAWANLDLRAESRRTTRETPLKADLTLGLAPSDRWLGFLQVQTSDYPGAGRAVRLVPTVVRRLTPNLSVESALLWDVAGGERAGVKLGLWLEF